MIPKRHYAEDHSACVISRI